MWLPDPLSLIIGAALTGLAYHTFKAWQAHKRLKELERKALERKAKEEEAEHRQREREAERRRQQREIANAIRGVESRPNPAPRGPNPAPRGVIGFSGATGAIGGPIGPIRAGVGSQNEFTRPHGYWIGMSESEAEPEPAPEEDPVTLWEHLKD